MMRWTTRQRMNLLKMKIKRKRMAVFLNGLRNGLSENKYLRRLRGLRRDSQCSMTDDTKIAIEACYQATSGFGPRSVRPIGRSKLFLDRSEIGSVQVQSPVGPVRLHLKKCRSYALDRTGPRPNRGCPSLIYYGT